jgi:uncharacterized protein
VAGLEGNTFFDGPAGQIEAILKEPKTAVSRVAVVCHPHPLYGGTMHNKVVFHLGRAFEHLGFATLRFNFRGTGRSAGVHDYLRGEQDDLRAALDFVHGKYPGAEKWLAGFSFGAAVMLKTGCRNTAVAALVAAGLPVSMYQFDEAANCGKPILFAQGSDDQFGPPADLQRFYEDVGEPKRLVVIQGADHFFEGHLAELQEAVTDFVNSTLTSHQETSHQE